MVQIKGTSDEKHTHTQKKGNDTSTPIWQTVIYIQRRYKEQRMETNEKKSCYEIQEEA